MTEVSKPHSELVARVRSALGASGRANEERGLAALRELVEQLQAKTKEDADFWALQKQHEQLGSDYESLKEQLETLRKATLALIECPNQDAPYHTTISCNFCSSALVQQARAAVSFPAISPLTCGKCGRSITEDESQWGWCPACADADPNFMAPDPASSDPDDKSWENTLMDGLEDEPPYPASEPEGR